MGYLLYQLILAWFILQKIKRAAKEISDKNERHAIAKELVDQIKVVRYEHITQSGHSVVLAYEIKDNKFLGQAGTQSELEAILKEKFPQSGIILVDSAAN